MAKKPEFQFSKEQTEELKAAISAYFLDELDVEVGSLQAEMFIDFLHQHAGKHYYNLGVTDTMNVMRDRTEDLIMLLKP